MSAAEEVEVGLQNLMDGQQIEAQIVAESQVVPVEPSILNLSVEVAQFLRNLLADQSVKVSAPDAQAAVYMATRALSELDAIIGDSQ